MCYKRNASNKILRRRQAKGLRFMIMYYCIDVLEEVHLHGNSLRALPAARPTSMVKVLLWQYDICVMYSTIMR